MLNAQSLWQQKIINTVYIIIPTVNWGYSSAVERSLCMREASGSNPDISTSFFFFQLYSLSLLPITLNCYFSIHTSKIVNYNIHWTMNLQSKKVAICLTILWPYIKINKSFAQHFVQYSIVITLIRRYSWRASSPLKEKNYWKFITFHYLNLFQILIA